MFYAVIIVALLLYGSFKTIPTAWEIAPELIVQGDSIMIVGLVSCIVAAIIAILIAIFKYFDGLYYALQTFLTICIIASSINAYILITKYSEGIIYSIFSSLIFQLQFALPIGLVTVIICGFIRYFMYKSVLK